MLEATRNLDSSEEIASRVGDSFEGLDRDGLDLGQSAQSEALRLSGFLAQNKNKILEANHVALGSGELDSPIIQFKGMGYFSPSLSNREKTQETSAVKLGVNHSQNTTDLSVVAEGEKNLDAINISASSDLVRLSQIPEINIMVDLNDAECRRRRRRQLSNLLSLHELENTQVVVANSTSSVDDSIEDDSVVGREILATLGIGGALGINFQPNSAAALRYMIEEEAKEYSLALVRGNLFLFVLWSWCWVCQSNANYFLEHKRYGEFY